MCNVLIGAAPSATVPVPHGDRGSPLDVVDAVCLLHLHLGSVEKSQPALLDHNRAAVVAVVLLCSLLRGWLLLGIGVCKYIGGHCITVWLRDGALACSELATSRNQSSVQRQSVPRQLGCSIAGYWKQDVSYAICITGNSTTVRLLPPATSSMGLFELLMSAKRL